MWIVRATGRSIFRPALRREGRPLLALDDARPRATERAGRSARLLPAFLGLWLTGAVLPEALPPGPYQPREPARFSLSKKQLRALREEALVRARVWRAPVVPIESADLAANPRADGGWSPAEAVICKYLPGPLEGATRKFECVLPGGEVLKVKYGKDNQEVWSELAATRLLRTLGFGADPVYGVHKVRCFGCPRDPYTVGRCLGARFEEQRRACRDLFGWEESVMTVDYGRYRDFAPAIVERRPDGVRLGEGWAWSELSKIDPRKGGAGRAEVDALRLVAVFLDHWDTKEDNQRLLCLSNGADASRLESCHHPLAYIQDAGGTFGRPKLDLASWESHRVWKDPDTCTVEPPSPLLHGTTFREVRISEAGRAFLAERLRRLSRRQVHALFHGAGFGKAPAAKRDRATITDWVRVFEDRVRQIADRPPCPVG
jgi:hypothetical protein